MNVITADQGKWFPKSLSVNAIVTDLGRSGNGTKDHSAHRYIGALWKMPESNGIVRSGDWWDPRPETLNSTTRRKYYEFREVSIVGFEYSRQLTNTLSQLCLELFQLTRICLSALFSYYLRVEQTLPVSCHPVTNSLERNIRAGITFAILANSILQTKCRCQRPI